MLFTICRFGSLRRHNRSVNRKLIFLARAIDRHECPPHRSPLQWSLSSHAKLGPYFPHSVFFLASISLVIFLGWGGGLRGDGKWLCLLSWEKGGAGCNATIQSRNFSLIFQKSHPPLSPVVRLLKLRFRNFCLRLSEYEYIFFIRYFLFFNS